MVLKVGLCLQMTKKSQKITSLQKLVEERAQAYSAAVARNAELEDELMVILLQNAFLEN